LGGADHRGAGADGGHVDQRAGGGLGGVDDPGHGHPEQDPDPGVLLHPGGVVGLGGGGGGGEDDPAHGRADQGLDDVVDVVDHRDLVEHDLGHQQARDDRDGPASLAPAVG